MKHKERVQKIRNFTEKNKVFTIMAVIAVIFLLSNFFFSKDNTEKNLPDTETVQAETEENPPKAEWQFYWSDLWILAVGGGFCTVMIIRERRKAKEELQ